MRKTVPWIGISAVAVSLLIFLAFSCQPPRYPQRTIEPPFPVFPGAQGFGTGTKAGRGGRIIKVTNLKDSGEGSLRAALEAEGPRIVVFEISGNIPLSRDLAIDHPYVTVAGQTAPSPGITLMMGEFVIRTHDVLVQHLRFRPGDVDPEKVRDGVRLDGYSTEVYNVVLDHISVSWAIDENLSTYRSVRDVTLINSIVSEGLETTEPSFGFIVGDNTTNISSCCNLFAHNDYRNPSIKGGASLVVLNNLLYNAGSHNYIYLIDDRNNGPIHTSIVGNVLIKGPNTKNSKGVRVFDSVKRGTKLYRSDNVYSGTFLLNSAGFDIETNSPPIWHPSFRVRDSYSVEAFTLANAGARPADRDAVDERIVREVRTRTGRIIGSQQDVEGWPELAENGRRFHIPEDPSGDRDGDGYTNIEEILHRMAAEVEGRAEEKEKKAILGAGDR